MIVVDEEYEASAAGQRRAIAVWDVVVMRSRLEGVPIILGSATPSLEISQAITEESRASLSIR